MINYIKKIFNKDNYYAFNIVECTLDTLPDITFKDIKSKTIDGIIIRKALNTNDCVEIIKKFNNVTKANEREHSFVYPISFAELDYKLSNGLITIDEYLEIASDYVENFESSFGIDLPNIVKKLVNKMNSDYNYSTIIPIEKERSIMPGIFRVQMPKKNQIGMHCGNQFNGQFMSFYKHIDSTLENINQLSYFFMLQKPDKGGELTLFNYSWREFLKKHTKNMDEAIMRKVVMANDKGRRKLLMENGDLLVFQGGDIFHRVEQVYGKKSRVTFGGHFRFSKKEENKSIYTYA